MLINQFDSANGRRRSEIMGNEFQSKKKFLYQYFRFENKIINFAQKYSATLLRYSFAIIYFWFGLLKLLGVSPAEELVYGSTEWMNFPHFIIVLSLWEIMIGIFFAIKKLNRVALLMFFLKVPGTFLPLFTNPEKCFTFFPFGLTLEGQYIFKNLLLISAALVIVATLSREKKQQDA
jgi:uncharacterized membrane protein YkgB